MKAKYEYPDGRIVELPASEPQPEGTVFVGFVDRAGTSEVMTNPLKIDTDLVLAWLVAEYGDLEGGKKISF